MNPQPGRDTNGRLVEGNAGNGLPHGNKTNAHGLKIRSRFAHLMTEDRLDILFFTLMKAATNGDVDAAKYLLDQVMGKPKQTVDVETNSGANAAITALQVIAGFRPAPVETETPETAKD